MQAHNVGVTRTQRTRGGAALGACCPQARRRIRLAVAASSSASSAPRWNPQNTEQCQTMPSPEFTPQQAVAVQLDAMARNDEPWTNHGVQTMYEFAEDCGSMERSRYFGFSKDLYHLDHFLGALKTACAALVDCTSYTILQGPPPSAAAGGKELEPLAPGMCAVYVSVVDSTGAPGGVFELRLVQRQAGLKAGCWMTKSCRRVATEQQPPPPS